jgi:LuxR family transcriptional regulator, maltose regulon positive regulatory protein
LEHDVETQQVRDYIRYVDLRPPPDAPAQWPRPLKLFALGGFEVLREDAPLESSRKPAKKPLALLKLIVCAGGSAVPVAQILDALWPESEADAAEKAFDVALHRLRALFGVPEAIKLADARVSLDRNRVWVDAWAFEALCRPRINGATSHAPENYARAAELFRGPLLPEETDAAWSVTYREKLHDAFNRLVRAQGMALEAGGDYDQALEWYARGLEADDLVEAMYQGVMRCHLQLGQRADALAAFQRPRRTLSSKPRTSPSARSAALAQQARSETK